MRSLLLTFGLVIAVLAAGPAAASPDPFRAIDSSVRVDPITLPVIRSGRAEKIVTFLVRVTVARTSDWQRVIDSMPKLHDALLTELAGLVGLNWPDGRVVDLEFARARLLARASRVFEPGTLTDVVFESIVERRV